jgi:queuine tRNA-ribosyltransferase
MLTDSGGYQIFSMGHGSVSSEIKGARGGGGGKSVPSAKGAKGNNNQGASRGPIDRQQQRQQNRDSVHETAQVQSLLRIDETGATFRSYVDGSVHHLTPELSIQTQRELGADFIVVLDECTPFNVEKNYTEASMHRSHRWALRSLREFVRTVDAGGSGRNPKTGTGGLPQALYGIVQGGVFEEVACCVLAYLHIRCFLASASSNIQTLTSELKIPNLAP